MKITSGNVPPFFLNANAVTVGTCVILYRSDYIGSEWVVRVGE